MRGNSKEWLTRWKTALKDGIGFSRYPLSVSKIVRHTKEAKIEYKGKFCILCACAEAAVGENMQSDSKRRRRTDMGNK